MTARWFSVPAGVLALATVAWAQGTVPSASGGLPGGTLSTKPGVGGVGVPGQVAGGTLSTRPGVGGVGVPAQVPGGTLATAPPCVVTGCAPLFFVPVPVMPAPEDSASAPEDAAPDEASDFSASP